MNAISTIMATTTTGTTRAGAITDGTIRASTPDITDIMAIMGTTDTTGIMGTMVIMVITVVTADTMDITDITDHIFPHSLLQAISTIINQTKTFFFIGIWSSKILEMSILTFDLGVIA